MSGNVCNDVNGPNDGIVNGVSTPLPAGLSAVLLDSLGNVVAGGPLSPGGTYSFSDLANNEKLEMAKELLLTSDMTVVQIAETLNYSNVQNFIRFFSKKVGMTPGKYRKDYQNEKK